jgi:hypothetical protein
VAALSLLGLGAVAVASTVAASARLLPLRNCWKSAWLTLNQLHTISQNSWFVTSIDCAPYFLHRPCMYGPCTSPLSVILSMNNPAGLLPAGLQSVPSGTIRGCTGNTGIAFVVANGSTCNMSTCSGTRMFVAAVAVCHCSGVIDLNGCSSLYCVACCYRGSALTRRGSECVGNSLTLFPPRQITIFARRRDRATERRLNF